MDEAAIRRLIDYFLSHQPTSWISYLPLIAAFVAAAVAIGISLYNLSQQIGVSSRLQIRGEWNGLMDACIRDPDFIDPSFTNEYVNSNNEPLLHKYQAFCYRAWSLVEFIIECGLQDRNPYRSIIYWIAAHHGAWIRNNPYMYSSPSFWAIYSKARNEPLTLFRSETLPRLEAKPAVPSSDRYEDNVDWNKVSANYENLIISPWVPEMTEPDPKKNGKCKNCLLNALNEYDPNDLRKLRVIDYGCGPGNMLQFLSGRVTEIWGLDFSKDALSICEKKAGDLGIKFHSIKDDMRSFVDPKMFDLIISTNSVLPKTREDVLRIFGGMHKNLKDDGRLLMILPSYDTCLYLVSLWEKHYRTLSNDEAYVKHCISAFRIAKKMDDDTHSFADDGVHSQCFHTPESMRRELDQIGFQIIEMKKVKYPWEYASRFDYGYFPEECKIWDWYVEAKKK
jgi:SAM-dependent methyltransferase